MPVSDSGFDNSSKTMKDDHRRITITGVEMGDATKITSKVMLMSLKKKNAIQKTI